VTEKQGIIRELEQEAQASEPQELERETLEDLEPRSDDAAAHKGGGSMHCGGM
jgi:hypothetical protein